MKGLLKMKKLTLHSALANDSIELPISFIDRFMPQASEAALKLYLYLLRAVRDPSILLSVSDMADLFDVTPNQILKGLSYWENLGLLSLEMHGNELAGIRILPVPSEDVSAPAKEEELPARAEKAPAQELSVHESTPKASSVPENVVYASEVSGAAPKDYDAVFSEPAFSDLLKLMECYTGKPVTTVLRNTIADCYLLFERQTDVMEYLLEYCAEMEKTSPYYIRTVARNWKEDGLNTLEEIKAQKVREKKDSARYTGVIKAFGLSRRLISEEQAYYDRWEKDFSEELILDACRRTVMAIHEPSFQYADSILQGWKRAYIRTMEDVEKRDSAFREAKQQKIREETEEERRKAAGKEAERVQKARKSSFHNMTERTDSYSSLIPSLYDK